MLRHKDKTTSIKRAGSDARKYKVWRLSKIPKEGSRTRGRDKENKRTATDTQDTSRANQTSWTWLTGGKNGSAMNYIWPLQHKAERHQWQLSSSQKDKPSSLGSTANVDLSCGQYWVTTSCSALQNCYSPLRKRILGSCIASSLLELREVCGNFLFLLFCIFFLQGTFSPHILHIFRELFSPTYLKTHRKISERANTIFVGSLEPC